MARKKMGDTRRKQILEGMLKAMAEHGLMKINMSDVAEAAGLSRGILHYYFKNKDEMIGALVAHLRDLHLLRFRSLTEKIEDSWQLLKDSLWYPIHAFGSSGGAPLARVWIAFWGLASHHEDVHTFIIDVQRELRRHFREIIQAGVATGSFSLNVNPERLASVILSVLEGSIVQWHMSPDTKLVSDNITELEKMLQKHLKV